MINKVYIKSVKTEYPDYNNGFKWYVTQSSNTKHIEFTNIPDDMIEWANSNLDSEYVTVYKNAIAFKRAEDLTLFVLVFSDRIGD